MCKICPWYNKNKFTVTSLTKCLSSQFNDLLHPYFSQALLMTYFIMFTSCMDSIQKPYMPTNAQRLYEKDNVNAYFIKSQIGLLLNSKTYYNFKVVTGKNLRRLYLICIDEGLTNSARRNPIRTYSP